MSLCPSLHVIHQEAWQNQYNETGKIMFDEVSGLSLLMQLRILIMNTFSMTKDDFEQDRVTKFCYKIWPLLAYFHLSHFSLEDYEKNMISIPSCPDLPCAFDSSN